MKTRTKTYGISLGILLLIGLIIGLNAIRNIKGNSNEAVIYSTLPENNVVQLDSVGKVSSGGKTIEIIISSVGFVPKNVNLKAGDKVVWLNQSGGAVSINSDLHPTHELYPILNLGVLGNEEKGELILVSPGTYYYHNHFKPSQTGAITVQ